MSESHNGDVLLQSNCTYCSLFAYDLSTLAKVLGCLWPLEGSLIGRVRKIAKGDC